MFTLLFRKMKNTKWMVICLLVGFIMASAMMSTIPLYMNASLQRMLVKDMQSYQLENDEYPGVYSATYSLNMDLEAEKQQSLISDMTDAFEENFDSLDLPVENSKKTVTDSYTMVVGAVSTGTSTSRVNITGMSDIEDNIEIIQGEMYTPGINDGVLEVIITDESLRTTGLTVGQTYDLTNSFNTENTIQIKVTGTFDVKDGCESYWSEGLDDAYVSTAFADYDTVVSEGIDSGVINIVSMSERWAIDYENIDMTSLDSVLSKLKEQDAVYSENGVTLDVPAIEIFEEYADRSETLQLLLWLVQIPVMLMIVFYLFMVSQLNVEQEKNEIAVFKSRGASRTQIMLIYALESLVLGVVTAIIGPLLGYGLCHILGASNGFLEFVNRTALPIKFTIDAFLYSLLAVGVFFVTTMVPIIPATKTTIVEHKASKAKKAKRPFWDKAFLDVILIVGSVGWLYYYNRTQENLAAEGLTDSSATVNPLLFVASTAFILGAALLVVRLYPFLIRLIYRIGKRAWSPAQYISLNNIGRSSTGRERFIMIFLILTVALGLFFANTARALNRNAENTAAYLVGCDAVIAEEWDSETSTSLSSSDDEDEEEDDSSSTTTYIEPLFEKFENLDGVNAATAVYKNDSVNIKSSRKVTVQTTTSDEDSEERRWEDEETEKTTDTLSNVRLMTVNPSEFANICWFKDDLLPVHINAYLNALSECSYGVILSSSFQDNYGYELGDNIEVAWGSNDYFSATVIAFVDYWPSMDPTEQNDNGTYIDFAIMNFNYVQVQTAVEPYEVWIDLDDDATVADFYASIEDAGIQATKLEVASQNITSEKNDPMLQGLNGALTLGFIIIMIMCIIGFLIYWILSIKSRTLQFGILRAMGMRYREIIAMIIYEQILVSGVAVICSIVIGGIASDLFVPLFRSMFTSQKILPFSVTALRSDYLKIYALILIMLLVGFAVLGRIISKIKISQALKLGED
ncbi:MAG: FtsX-like permease family protein [Ruminococcus sp.]|nr:FtsX-like permease family protein [Ruminococcus sp.]